MINIAVSGALGKIGSYICEIIEESEGLAISGLLERNGHPEAGKLYHGQEITCSPEIAFKGASAVIDFSSPENAAVHAAACIEKKAGIVIGTTGISKDVTEELKKISEKIPVLVSPNMSIGVNLLFKVIGEMNQLLTGYDREVVEAHHSRKADAPSGTAMEIARILQKPGDRLVYGREGCIGPRKKDEIGVFAVRGGNIIGEHTVMWISENDRIEVTHRAQSRKMFAEGAVRAAVWIAEKGRKPGYYSMHDVLK